MECNKRIPKEPPKIDGQPGFNALAQRVFEKGVRKITRLEGLQKQYRELLGSESDDISGKLDAEASRLERILTKMVEIKRSKMKWEDLEPTELSLLIQSESRNHEEDEVYKSVDDPEIRKRIAQRDLDENEYNQLLYGSVFKKPPEEEPEAEAAPPAPAKTDKDTALGPTMDSIVVALERERLDGQAAHISASVGYSVGEVRERLARYSDEDILSIVKAMKELGVTPKKVVAIDLILREDGVQRESMVLTTIGQSGIAAKGSDSRLQRALSIAVCAGRVERTMISVFVQAYSEAFAKRMGGYTESLAKLRYKILNEEGPGREFEAQERFKEESKKIRQPVNRVDEFKPKLSTRHLARISQLLCHDVRSLEAFVDYFEGTFDLTPKELDKSARSLRIKEMAEFLGVSGKNAASLLRKEERDRKLDSYNPTAERQYRALTEVLREFIAEHFEIVDINEEAKLFPHVHRIVEERREIWARAMDSDDLIFSE